MQLNYAIVFVSDMKESMIFYRDVLGLPLRFESPVWTEFATGGATIALHTSDEVASGGDRPRKSQPGTCRPGLGVPDLAAFHKQMMEKQVPCLQEPKDVFGVRIAQYADPDGLPISVSEARG